MTWVEVPFVGGQREDIEARILPTGLLQSATNLSLEKPGRLSKRHTYAVESIVQQLSGVAVTSGEVISVTSYGGQRLITTGDNAFLYSWLSAYDYTGGADREAESSRTRMPAHGAATRTVQPQPSDQCDSAAGGDYVLCAVLEKVNDSSDRRLVSYLYLSDGVLVSRQVLATTSSNSISQIQCAGDSNVLAVGWLDGTDVEGAYLELTSGQPDTELQLFTWGNTYLDNGSAWSMVVRDGQDSNDPVRLHAAWQSNAATITIATVEPGNGVTATAVTDSGGNGTLHCAIYSNLAQNRAWVAWGNATTDEVRAASDDALCASFAADFLVDDTMPPSGAPIMVLDDATNDAWIAWNTGSYGSRAVVSRRIDLTSTTSALQLQHGIIAMSKLSSDSNMSSGDLPIFVAYPEHDFALNGLVSLYLVNLYRTDTIGRSASRISLRIAEQSAHPQLPGPHRQNLSRGTARRWAFAAQTTDRSAGVDTEVSTLWTWTSDVGYEASIARPCQHGSLLYFTGGIITVWDGQRLEPACFLEPPEIVSAAASASSGFLEDESTYSYIAVYERRLADGSIMLSAPSEPATVVLATGEDAVDLEVLPARLQNFLPPASIRLYRTQANGQTFTYQGTYTSKTWLESGMNEILDLVSDDSLADNHDLYTDVGGVLGNDAPPGGRYLASTGDRLWVAGSEDPYRARASKLLFPGEAASWPRTEEFSVTVPEPITGLGTLDSTLVVFTSQALYYVTGDGPDDSGAGVFAVRKIPVNSGLKVGAQASICECVHGLVYQSDEGLQLLPRGFGPPELISEPVRDTIALHLNTSSAVVDATTQELRLTVHDGSGTTALLAWDLRTRAWFTSTIQESAPEEISAAGLWGADYVLGTPNLGDGLLIDTRDAASASEYLPSTLVTGDLRVDKVQRFSRCRAVELLLEYRGPCELQIELSQDGGVSWPYSTTWDLTSGAYSVGDTVALRWHLPRQKGTRHRFRITDSEGESLSSAGVVYLGMAFDLRAKADGGRLPAARRA